MHESLNGSDVLREVATHLGIDLCSLVAGCAFWAPNEENTKVPKFPKICRARKGKGEKRRETVDGITFDDNTYANKALKAALKHAVRFEGFKGFAVCHIWPDTCYDPRYHTLLANLVLLPSALASLTDHYDEIEKCLQYRSWELYKWHPQEKKQPKKPRSYPENWRSPIPPHRKHGSTTSLTDLSAKPSPAREKKLPITLEPPKEDEFRKAFMQQGEAKIHITHSDGRIETKIWKKMKLNKHSKILGNLRSRPEFRNGEWQKNGIKKVKVVVSGY